MECSLQPSRVYTISGESNMLASSHTSKESLELDVLREARDAQASTSSSPIQHHRRHHANPHHGTPGPNLQQPADGASGSADAGPSQSQHHHHHHHHHHLSQPLQSSVSAHNIRGWGEGKECSLACDLCPGAPSRSHGSLELESSMREPGKQRRPLERMSSVDRVTFIDRGEKGNENRERERQEIRRDLCGCAVVCIFFVSLSLCLCEPLSSSVSVHWTCVCVCVYGNTLKAESYF